MREKGKAVSWIYYVLVASVFSLILSSICAMFSRRPINEAVYFSAFQILAILIPGFAYAQLLKQDQNRSGVAVLFIAYALGYSSNIILYYLLFVIGNLQSNAVAYFWAFGIQCSISIVYLSKKKISYGEENCNWLIAIFFIVLMFVIELFTYSGYNMLPPYTDGSNIWKDIRYWLGNTVALKLDYPPVEFRNLNPNYTYHYFTSMQLAVESIVTRIPVAELSIYFSYIQPIVLIVGGVYCLAERYIEEKIGLISCYFLLIFSSGYESITRVSYVSHIYMSQYGFDYGLGFMLFLLMALDDFWQWEFSLHNYFFICILFSILMGVKSPFACIAIVGIGCMCLYFLLHREWEKAFLQGMTVLALFVLLYLSVCNIEHVYSGRDIKNAVDITTHHWDVCENLEILRSRVFQIKYIPDIVLEIFYWILFVILCNPILFISTFIFITVKFIKCKKMDWLDASCLVMAFVGVSIALYVHMEGKSNVYFAMATYPVAWFIIVRSSEKLVRSNKVAWVAFLGVIFLFGGNLFLNHAAYDSIIVYWKEGEENYTTLKGQVMECKQGISPKEYETLQYVKENIDDKEILISINNRIDDNNLTGIIAERKVLNVYSENIILGEVSIEKLRKETDIDYLIIPNNIYLMMDLANRVIFENNEWKIIKIETARGY